MARALHNESDATTLGFHRVGPTPADVAREVRLLAAEGVSHFQVAFDDVESLDRFVVEVVPTLRT